MLFILKCLIHKIRGKIFSSVWKFVISILIKIKITVSCVGNYFIKVDFKNVTQIVIQIRLRVEYFYFFF